MLDCVWFAGYVQNLQPKCRVSGSGRVLLRHWYRIIQVNPNNTHLIKRIISLNHNPLILCSVVSHVTNCQPYKYLSSYKW